MFKEKEIHAARGPLLGDSFNVCQVLQGVIHFWDAAMKHKDVLQSTSLSDSHPGVDRTGLFK